MKRFDLSVIHQITLFIIKRYAQCFVFFFTKLPRNFRHLRQRCRHRRNGFWRRARRRSSCVCPGSTASNCANISGMPFACHDPDSRMIYSDWSGASRRDVIMASAEASIISLFLDVLFQHRPVLIRADCSLPNHSHPSLWSRSKRGIISCPGRAVRKSLGPGWGWGGDWEMIPEVIRGHRYPVHTGSGYLYVSHEPVRHHW